MPFPSLEHNCLVLRMHRCICCSPLLPFNARLDLMHPPAAAAQTSTTFTTAGAHQAHCQRHNRRYCGSQRFRLPLPVPRPLSVIVFGRLQALGELGFCSRPSPSQSRSAVAFFSLSKHLLRTYTHRQFILRRVVMDESNESDGAVLSVEATPTRISVLLALFLPLSTAGRPSRWPWNAVKHLARAPNY